LSARRIAALGMAINFRLMALARLQRDADLYGWSMPGKEPGAVSISMDVLRVAARERLMENAERQAVFDAESFRRRLLAVTEPDGRA
jgi:hypothetical protein